MVISMKAAIHSRYLSWVLRGFLALLTVAATCGFCFVEGMFYANRRATVTIANDGCWYNYTALAAMKEPEKHRYLSMWDYNMDLYGEKLADTTLRYPRLIERYQYGVLKRFRGYRAAYGRESDRNDGMDYQKIDSKVSEAIARLEALHNTNEWGQYKFDFNGNGDLRIKQGR